MRGRRILVERRADGGAAAALLIDGRLEDLLVDPPAGDPTPRPEAIHRAVVGRPMKGVGGVIVDLGGGATGFLRGPKPPAAGSRLLVQVSSWAEARKAPPVTARLLLKGAFVILTPGAPGANVARSVAAGAERERLEALARRCLEGAAEGLGIILRTLAATAEPEAVAAEAAALRGRWERLEGEAAAGAPGLLAEAPDAGAVAWRDWRVRADEPVEDAPGALAEAGVWEAAAALDDPRVALPGGGAMTVEATRALVAVDVDTGGDLSPAAGLKATLAAMRELPRQLRLRGLGGQVTVDPAPLGKADRRRVEDALRAALRADGIETTIAGWTPLGHLELLRKRARRPLTGLPRG